MQIIDLILSSSSPVNGAKRRCTMDTSDISFLGAHWNASRRPNLSQENSLAVTLQEEMDAAGTEILHDSSDDENDAAETGGMNVSTMKTAHDKKLHDTDPESSMELTAIAIPKSIRVGYESGNDNDNDNDNEETMELTGQVNPISFIHKQASVANSHNNSNHKSDGAAENESGSNDDSEPEMELTKNMRAPSFKPKPLVAPPELLTPSTELPHIENEQEESDMELTQAHNVALSNNIAHQLDDLQVEMEFSQPRSVSLSTITESTIDESVHVNEEEEEMEEMELTQHRSVTLSTIIENSVDNEAKTTPIENEEQEMEMTQVVGRSLVTPNTNIPPLVSPLQDEDVQEESSKMEITQVVSNLVTPRVTIKQDDEANQDGIQSPSKHNEAEQSVRTIIHSARPLVITTKLALTDADGEEVEGNEDFEHNDEQQEPSGNLTESQEPEYYDDADSYLPVELSDFLADIGIAFLEDEDVDVRMDTLSNEVVTHEHSPSDYVKAYAKLQLYNLYAFACEELTHTSKESAELFKEFDNVIRENNPQIFRKFYQADESDRAHYRLKFHMLKQFARYQLEKIWYEWRIQTIETVLERLEEKYIDLQEDKERLLKDLAMIEEISTHVNHQYQRMEDDCQMLEKREQELSTYTPDQLDTIREKYEGLSSQLSQVSQELESKQESAVLLERSLRTLEELKERYLQELTRNTILLNERKKFEQQDVVRLMQEFKVIVQLLDIQIMSFQDKEMLFLLDKHIIININLDDVLNLDNINFELPPRTWFHFGNLQERIKQIWMLMPSANVFEVYRNFVKVYYNLKQLDEDLYLIGLKFRVQFDSDNSSGKSGEEGMFSIQFNWYDFESKTNAVIHLMIALRDLVAYPPAFKIRVERVSTTNKWKPAILRDMVKNGLLNSATLAGVVTTD
ncbi:uncharacterized protein KQ657_004170 [Scheffersomyces spartinae]|uniref:Spc7 kinetochore protein domain-containing protein n=1 Tax=Scheffersomyces spartinae TaxID=45513 RepID=A0A9P7VBJ7_9ASCO|nr:uncharacterized protein KQ657_004170 [Scheffersomyces spartinae]KAG7195056.1 hypothetical protein KQ657_004170 [Scheffersomyces spartinae]